MKALQAPTLMTPLRPILIAGALLFVAAPQLSGCCFGGGPSLTPEQIATRNITALRHKKAALEQELAGWTALANADKGTSDVVLVTVDPRDLTRALRRAMPVTFPASSLDRRVGGTVIVDQVANIRYENRKTRLTLVARGSRIKLNVSVPGPYKRMANELVAGIQSGVSIGLRGDLYVENGRLFFKGIADKIKLKKHNQKNYQGMVRDGVTRSLLSRPHVIELYPVDAGRGKLSLKSAHWVSGRLALIFAR